MTWPGVGCPAWNDLPTSGEHPEIARRFKHDAFIEAARHIVATEGRERLTMERLAKAVGCAIGTVYTYFSSKDAILEQMDARALEALCRSLEVPIETEVRPGADPEAACLVRILHLARALAHPSSEHQDGVHALRHVLASSETPHALLSHVSALIDIAADMLNRAQERGALEPGDAGLRARVLVSTAVTSSVLGVSNEQEYEGEPLTSPSGPVLARALVLSWGARRRTLLEAGAELTELMQGANGERGDTAR